MNRQQKQPYCRLDQDEAIVSPATGSASLNLGPFAVMLSMQGDLNMLCEMMHLGKEASKSLFMSKIYIVAGGLYEVSLTGPFVGAPYAAMILETLIAGGVRCVLFVGWCGAISPKVRIGDVVVPTAAFIEEGTSQHYDNGNVVSRPSELLVKKITAALANDRLAYHEGKIWSTDAVFRETKDKVRQYQTKKVLAVEMEASALFTVGNFRNIDVAAILVVSDELSSLKWRPGFKQKRFKQMRTAVCEVIKRLCLQECPQRL